MEQRITTKVNDHMIQFKTDVKEWMKKHGVYAMRGGEDVTMAFLHYLYSYENPTFTEDDFQKRKRTSCVISPADRCVAKRSNNEQCSRRRKAGMCFCGTHAKGTPYGVVTCEVEKVTTKKVEIWTEEVNGIFYYLDHAGNVYSPEDIVQGNMKPSTIGKWSKDEQGQYLIHV